MARPKNKPFTKAELKILIRNKMKDGMSYREAWNHIHETINTCVKTDKDRKEREKKERDEIKKEIVEDKNFKKEFKKL